jgi:hypothetical protein
MRLSDFCWAMGLCPFVLGLTDAHAGTQQISQGKTFKFRDHPVANTPAAPTEIGLHR